MIPKVLGLIQTSFAYMDGRIDPPSSMYALTLEAGKDQATLEEVICNILSIDPTRGQWSIELVANGK